MHFRTCVPAARTWLILKTRGRGGLSVVKYNLHLCANEKLPAMPLLNVLIPACHTSSSRCLAHVELILEICNRDKSILGRRKDQSNQRDRKFVRMDPSRNVASWACCANQQTFSNLDLADTLTLIFGGGDEGIYP